MEQIQVQITDNANGRFYIVEDTETLAELVFSIKGKDMTVMHTEVSEKLEGKGVGKQLIAAMADYVRKQEMKVIPLCPFVHLQFKRHPEEYADIWKRENEKM